MGRLAVSIATPMIMPGDLVVIDGQRKTLHSAPKYALSDVSTCLAKGTFGWGLFAIVLSIVDHSGMICIIDSAGTVGKTFVSWLSTPEEVVESQKKWLKKINSSEEYDA